jgi:hypothetical protein
MQASGEKRFATASLLFNRNIMRLFELFEKAKPAKKITAKIPAPRNFVAKNAQTSGAGAHDTKKKKLKRDEKRLSDD